MSIEKDAEAMNTWITAAIKTAHRRGQIAGLVGAANGADNMIKIVPLTGPALAVAVALRDAFSTAANLIEMEDSDAESS